MFTAEDVISTYTREQAIEDGVLIDVSPTAKEAGIKFPLAVTSAVWDEVITPDKFAIQHGESFSGRLWDVVWMLRIACKTHFGSLINYQLLVTRGGHKKMITLKAVCGPGDNAEPTITIMFPEED